MQVFCRIVLDFSEKIKQKSGVHELANDSLTLASKRRWSYQTR